MAWGLPAPVGGLLAFGFAAVVRPNQIELLVLDIGQAVKSGAAGGNFFAGVGIGLNACHAKKALVFGGNFFAKAGVVLCGGFAHEPRVFGGLFIAVFSPCSVQNQGRSQKNPTPFLNHFSAHLINQDGLYFNRQSAGEMNIFAPLVGRVHEKDLKVARRFEVGWRAKLFGHGPFDFLQQQPSGFLAQGDQPQANVCRLGFLWITFGFDQGLGPQTIAAYALLHLTHHHGVQKFIGG